MPSKNGTTSISTLIFFSDGVCHKIDTFQELWGSCVFEIKQVMHVSGWV